MKMLFLFLAAFAWQLRADDSQRLLRVDHYVTVRSVAPSINGQTASIYVREVVQAGVALRGQSKGVVLFVHGAGTPAEVAFDVPYADYSWMAHLAQVGFDVFAMDMTGYGRSSRPAPMQDPCNLNIAQRAQFPFATAACPDQRSGAVTTIESDWHDIDAVVEHVRKLRGVAKVNLAGWSLGGPRAGGYSMQHPEKVSRLVLLSPAYSRARPSTGTPPPAQLQAASFNTQSRTDFDANWDRQLGCEAQVDPAARESVWAEMLASDPVGATWGPGVRRAPNVAWGGKSWNPEAVAKAQVPALFVAAALDKQVVPEGVKALHNDYGAADKVLVDLACTSHNALWEKDHLLLFRASAEWFANGTVIGNKSGVVRIGY